MMGLTSLISMGIFVGFASFFVMEKTLRVLGGGEDEHGHSHSHSHLPNQDSASSSSVSKPDSDKLRSRSSKSKVVNGNAQSNELIEGADDEGKKQSSGPSKLSAYLNLFGDFVHNM